MFGMNVDVFKNDPPLKWYFIGSVPFMVLLLILTVALRQISFSKLQSRVWQMMGSDQQDPCEDLP